MMKFWTVILQGGSIALREHKVSWESFLWLTYLNLKQRDLINGLVRYSDHEHVILECPHYGIKICNSDQFHYFLMHCDAYYELKVCNMQHFNAELIYNLNVYVNRMLFIQIPTTVFPHSLVFSVLFNFTFWSFLAVDFFLGLLLLPLKKDLITYTNAETATLLLKKLCFSA